MSFRVVELDRGGLAFISTANSTSTPLGSGATFTGTAEEIYHYSTITIQVFSNVDSAVDGLVIEYSVDGTNWDDDDSFTITGNDGKFFTLAPQARYVRVRYTNGGTAQTTFRLQVIYHLFRTKPSSHKLTSSLTHQDDAELVRSVISGQIDGSTSNFANARVSVGGRLLVDIGAPTPEDPGRLVVAHLQNAGSHSLLVNGSVTPVAFQFSADPTDDIIISEVKAVFICNSIDFGENHFGNQNALTNGCLFQITTSGTTTDLANVQINEHFLEWPGSGLLYDSNSPKDILVARYVLGGAARLIAGSADNIKVTVRDNLTASSYQFFHVTAYGAKQ